MLGAYSTTLLEVLIAVVTAAMVITCALYTFSAEHLPGNHAMMLTMPFVLYGISRYLYLVCRKDPGGSPDHVLLTDRPLLCCIVSWGYPPTGRGAAEAVPAGALVASRRPLL